MEKDKRRIIKRVKNSLYCRKGWRLKVENGREKYLCVERGRGDE